MAITERLMAPGNFTVNFSQEFTPTAIIESIKEWGHIVVTPQEIDVDTLNDSDILSSSRYTGIVLNRTLEEGVVTVAGQGLELYLGDGSGKGMVIAESNNIGKVRTYTNVTLSEALFNSSVVDGKPFGIMRDEAGNLQAIQQGTISDPATLYTGQHFVETALSALKFVSEILNTEYRVNPNGTIDAGPSANLFVGVGSNEPTSVVVKSAYGEDPEYEGVTPSGLRSEFDATDWVSRVDFTGEVGYFNIPTDVAGEASLSSIPYKDLHGNDLKRVGLVQEPEAPEEHLNTRAQAMLNELARVKKILNLDLTQYEVSGDMKVGDFVYAFDPDVGFVDTDEDATAESRDKYEVTFRGQTITPAKVRVTGLTFPIMSGMGVYFRDKDGNYTDLTEYVQFESGATQVELGDVLRSIRDDLRFNEFSLSRQNAGVFSIPDLPATPTLQSGTYLDSTGDSKGFIRITFNRPLNEDGSQITDGSHYKVRYKKTTDNEYSYMNFPYTNASSESLILQDLTVGVSYQIGVATVDRSGFKKMSSYDGAGEDLYTDSASVNANFASNAVIEIEKDGQAPSKPKQAQSIAAGPLRVQVTHYLGKDGLDGGGNPFGDFTLEGDLDHLDVHAVAQSGNVQDFTVAESNKIGEVRVTSGNLLQGIPVVGTMELEDSQDYYFRIVAVDKSGNESDPSDGQSAVANLIEEANIADANITEAKIGTAAITTAKIADATITDAKITDLSAGKITSGSIIGGEITVGGVANTSGFIKSYNYSSGSAGWIINANGSAEFDAAVIRGTLDASQINVTNIDAANISTGTLNVDRLPTITTSQINFTASDIDGVDPDAILATINASSEGIEINANRLDLSGTLSVGDALDVGGSDASSFHVDVDGNMWLGAGTYASAPFKVSNTGALAASSFSLTGGSATNLSLSLDDAGNTQTPAANRSIAFGSSVIYESTALGGLQLKGSGDTVYIQDKLKISSSGTADDPALYFAGISSNDDPGFYTANLFSGGTRTELYWSNGDDNILHSRSDSTLLYLDASGVSIGGSTGGSSQYIGKNSSGTFGWHNLASGSHSHTESDISNIGSHAHSSTSSWLNNDHGSHTSLGASGGIYGSSSNASRFDHTHSGFLTSESNLSMSTNNGDVSGSPFITNVSGHNIVRTNSTSTNVTMRSIFPPFHSSGAYVYDLGNGPLYSYDDIWGAGSNIASDKKIKENIVETDLGLDFINSLNPVKYKFKDVDLETVENWDENKSPIRTRTHYGLLAQEVKEALKTAHPDNYTLDAMVVHTPNEEGQYIGEDDEFEGWALRYTELISPLVKAVQELSAENEALKLRVEALEG